jgi:hypothetical protein
VKTIRACEASTAVRNGSTYAKRQMNTRGRRSTIRATPKRSRTFRAKKTLVGDALKKNVVDALVTAFEHVIDPESGMRENIASEAERNKRASRS